MIADSIESDVKRNSTISQWIFNPFYYLAGIKALAIGIIIILITGYLASLNNCFCDGLIIFSGSVHAPLWHFVSQGIITWLLLSTLLLISGEIISKSRIRIIDVFGTQALAQFPFLFLSLVVMIPGVISVEARFYNSLGSSQSIWHLFSLDLFAHAFLTLLYIVIMAWAIVLRYRAYVVSCNVSGRKAITAFFISLFIVVIISRIVFIHFTMSDPVVWSGTGSQTEQSQSATKQANYEVVLQLLETPAQKITLSLLRQTEQVISSRLRYLEVPYKTDTVTPDKIIVRLGVSDTFKEDTLVNIISVSGLFSLHLVHQDNENIVKQSFAPGFTEPQGFKSATLGKGIIFVKSEPELVGDVDEAEVLTDQASDAYYIAVHFKPGGTERLSRITEENIGRRLAIMLDEKIHSAPVIRAPITQGRASITGNFTLEEARDLAVVLKSGAIPVPIRVLAAHSL